MLHVRPTLAAAILTAVLSSASAGLAHAEDGHTPTGQPCWATSGTSSNGLYHARELDCLANSASGSGSQPTVAPPTKPSPTATAQLVDNRPSTSGPSTVALDTFFHIFQLAVPGGAYQTDDVANSTSTLTTFAGAADTGQIGIGEDGNYIWVDPWDGQVHADRWTASGQTDYPIVLHNGQGGRDWYVGVDTTGYAGDQPGIILWDGLTLAGQYRGRPNDGAN